ncbi:MAG: hypothetical protein AB1497_12140 [Bacillota bacterium]
MAKLTPKRNVKREELITRKKEIKQENLLYLVNPFCKHPIKKPEEV